MLLRLILAVITILASLALSGCLPSREIEHLEYVNSIGIDYKNDKAYLYVQLISFSNIAKQEATAREPEVITIGKGTGETLEEAFVDLYNTSQQRLAWSQIKSVIYTKEALKHPKIMNEWMDMFNRYFEFRYTVWTFGTNEPMDDLFNTKQILNVSSLYSRLSDPMDMYSQNSYFKPIYLYEFVREWNEPAATILLPVISIAKGRWEEDQKEHPMYKIIGIFPIKSHTHTDFLERDHLLGLRWLEEKTVRSPIYFPNYGHMIVEKPKVKIIPSQKGEKVSFDIQVEASGYLTRMLKGISQRTLEKQVAEKMKKEIRRTYEMGLEKQIDVLNFSHLLYRKDTRAWKRLNQNGYIPFTADSLNDIQVKVKLKHTGLAKSQKHVDEILHDQ